MRIGIVAGETSGDILGAGLIRALRERLPLARFEGVAGPEMQAAGCEALYPAETLAVMGLSEVLAHLPRLLSVRRHLVRHFRADPPDVFIGIDSPDFNLGLEKTLRRAGIPTVHYVSPSIWAWRPKRVFKVGHAADLTLAILPFEPPLYAKHGFKAVFVGHPLADAIPDHVDRVKLRSELHMTE
ncbi:MAG TPA: lipid-A-disaccharide synthase, partial [Gammaproteobacteria bacterium]|nr:lipid-A-disaccharide synthase [Gammaproteobacteria bacterium]